MQFNKGKFNKGRFNTLDSLTVVTDGFLGGKGDIDSNAIRMVIDNSTLDGKGGINSYVYAIRDVNSLLGGSGDILVAELTNIKLISGNLDGAGNLIASAMQRMETGADISGTSIIEATVGVDGYITASAFMDGKGLINAIPVTISQIGANLYGSGNISSSVVKVSPVLALLAGRGDVKSYSYAVRALKVNLYGESNIKALGCKVIFTQGYLEGKGNILSNIAKVFYMDTTLKGTSNILSLADYVAVCVANIDGEGNIYGTPYFIYVPQYIISPTRLVIEDNKTKVVII